MCCDLKEEHAQSRSSLDGRNTPARFLSMPLYLSPQAHMASAICVSAHIGAPDVLQKVISSSPSPHKYIIRAFVKVQTVRTTTEGFIRVVTERYNSFSQFQQLLLILKSDKNPCCYSTTHSFCQMSSRLLQ